MCSSDLPTPSLSRQSAVPLLNASTMQVTPTPSRFRDALAETPSRQHNFATQVFSLLNAYDVTLPAKLTSELGDILNAHELRTQGVIKGRDITRLALKARDAKVVELEARIARLEADRELRVESLKWEQSILQSALNSDTNSPSDEL